MQFWDLHPVLGVQLEQIVANGRLLEVQLDDYFDVTNSTMTLR